jgi:hypothetical protein
MTLIIKDMADLNAQNLMLTSIATNQTIFTGLTANLG